MIADLFFVKEAGKKGKGVFATRSIPKGTFVYFDCKKCKMLNTKKAWAKLSKEEIRFFDVHGRYCDDRLCYTNHSCNSNVMDLGNGVDIVVRDIEKGEEQTEDYRILCDKEVRFSKFPGGCQCGEPNCIRKGTYRRPPSKELERVWNRKINGALRLVSAVNQPLRVQLLKEHKELSPFFDKRRTGQKASRLMTKLGKMRAAPRAEYKLEKVEGSGLVKS